MRSGFFRNSRRKRLIVGCLVYIAFCFQPSDVRCTDNAVDRPPFLTDEQIRQLRLEIPALDLSAKPEVSATVKAYFRSYDLISPGGSHLFGLFSSGKFSLAAHVFKPLSPRGTIFLLHGYFDHSGILKNLIRHCLKDNWVVVCFDLPGHGLSTGDRGAIDDFSQYANALEDLISMCSPRLPRPYQLIGHSLGGAVILEHIFNQSPREEAFDTIVLLAPLVHHSYYYLARFQYFLAEPFTEYLPRVFRSNSSDQDFLRWLEQDPLQVRKIALNWLEALYDWNARIERKRIDAESLLIIQGTSDKVVDWQYNIEFLKEKCDSVTVKWIKDGRHQLLNEQPSIRNEVLLTISTHLRGRGVPQP